MLKKTLSLAVSLCFFLSTLGPLPKAHADSPLGLPVPGTMVNLSPAYEPALIKGITVHKDNPFLFDFIVDTGNSGIAGDELKKQGDRLVKYFFACLTIPEKDLWVNLSPYEKDRMVPQALGQTALGRDLLAQDYILKQLTASLIYPEKDLGKEFWDRVYAKATLMYGTTQIPVNTFNKVWIVADKASVYEHGQTAFVVSGHMKVMLEEDYLAMQKHTSLRGAAGDAAISKRTTNDSHTIASQIVREIVLPEIEKEVNTGKNFATLRQIFNSLILASWYKKNLKEALLTQVYADKSTVKGVNLSDPSVKEQIYQQYLKAYKKGVFNYIKEEGQPDGQTIPRKYFSGGFDSALVVTDDQNPADAAQIAKPTGNMLNFTVGLGINNSEQDTSQAMTSSDNAMSPDMIEELKNAFVLWDEQTALLDSTTGKNLVGGKSFQAAKYWKDDPENNLRSFSATAKASIDFLDSNPDLLPEIYRITREMDSSDEVAREEAGNRIRALIINTTVPASLEKAIREAYRRLVNITEQPLVAVRSSGRAEDISLNIPELAGINLGANAGQHDTYLGEIGEEAAVKRWKDCIASLYTSRVLGYRDSMMVFSAFGKILPDKTLTADIITKLKTGNEEDNLVARAIEEKNIMIISSLKLLRALERHGFNEAANFVKEARESFIDIEKIAMGVTFMPMAGVDISFVAFGHEMTSSWTGKDFQDIPAEEYLNKGRVVTITTNYGLGESIVQGAAMPDTFLVHIFEDEGEEHINILSRTIGTKSVQTVYVAPMMQELNMDEQSKETFLRLLNTKDTRTFLGSVEGNVYQKMNLKSGADLFIVKDVLDRLIKEKVDTTSSVKVTADELAQFQYTREELNKLAHLLKAFLKDPDIKTIFTDVPQELRNQFSATDEQVRKIAREYMKKAKDYDHLVDMEGAVGKNFSRLNTAVTVQRRPSNVDGDVKEPQMIKINYTYVKASDIEKILAKNERIKKAGGQLTNIIVGDQLVQGIPTRNSFSGMIFKIDESKDLTPQFEEIKILADLGKKIIIRTNETTPDYIDVLKYKNVMGVIANSGGATSHAAVVSRELGIATVVGIQGWLDKLADTLGHQKANEILEYLDTTGNIVTVDANAGEETGLGTVYAGELPISTRDIEIDVSRLPYIYTKIGYIMGMPHPMLAMSKMSQYEGYYGVALMRGEFAYAEENINPRAGRAYDLLLINDYLKTYKQNHQAKNYYARLTEAEQAALDKFNSFLDRRTELRRQGQRIPLDITEQYVEQFKGKHPGVFLKALSTYQQTDIELLRNHSEELHKLTKQLGGYVSYNEFFDAVHGGAVGTMAAANSQTDNTVVYRSIDFKKNEAAELIGSKIFDPIPESATMVGERGARWLLKPENRVILVEEIRMLLRQVKSGYKNIGFMFPFVSTPEELDQLLTILEEEERDFSDQENKAIYLREVGQMVELPSNIIQAEEFIQVLKSHENKTKAWFKDKFAVDIKRKSFLSFGTNDLTQLTLGADRDNPKMRQLFNEAHPFVIESIRHVVNMANKYGIKCGLCGQALVNLVNVDPEKAEEILMLLGSTGGYAGTDYLGTVAAITRSASATLKHGKVADEVVSLAEPISRNFESTLERGAAARPLYQVTNLEDMAKTYLGDFIFVHDGILFDFDKNDKLKEQLSRLGAIIYSDDKLADVIKKISKKLRVPAIKVTVDIDGRLVSVPNGEKVTIDFNRHIIYRGDLKVSIDLPEIASKINVHAEYHPELAKIKFSQTFRVSDLYRDLKIYPTAFLAYDDLEKRHALDSETIDEIEHLMRETKSNSAVDVLRHEIKSRITSEMIEPDAKMVYETSDLQSDDLMKLLGHQALGAQEETNPPLGFYGLEALMDDPYLKELFKIEMETLKGLIDRGFNISIQFNSIKTPKSLQQAMEILGEIGIDPTKVKVGMDTAWPGNYLFLEDYLVQGLSFVTLDERKLAEGYLAADLYKNRRVQNTYQWKTIKKDMDNPKKMIEEAIAEFSARKHEVAIRTIPFDFAMNTDKAIVAPVSTKALTPGGIDLNSTDMGMTITRDTNGGVQVNFDPAMIERIKAQGVFSAYPVIIRITPMSQAQISPLLGLKFTQNSLSSP